MGKHYKFVSLPNLHYFAEGLSINVPECADVLDSTLAAFNEKTRIPHKIFAWNRKDPATRGKLSFPGGRIIVDMTQLFSREKGMIYLAKVMQKKDEDAAPVVFFTMHSPTLDIPMRTEVPLRALIKGGVNLRGTYCVYLHALLSDDGREFVYYGVTKRGWNNRFLEHTRAALGEESRRLFPLKLKELCEARADQLHGTPTDAPNLAGIVTAICATGLDENAAMDAEEYLVDKYSLSSKHMNGLNMIPGGREGIRMLHTLSIGGQSPMVETEEREAALDGYLRQHPQLGIPKPGVAEKWNDPAYAEAVICARENRLSADQVREIRYLAALGNSIDQIRMQTGALDNGQVSRVIAGRTYSRIQ